MDILSKITDAMQFVLSETAKAITRQTGFIKIQRKLTGSDFAQTLVFGWLDNPDSTIEELAQTAATLGVSITPQGLDKRFTPVVMIIQHWMLLTSWQYPDRSLFKSLKTIRKHAMNLAMAFSSGCKDGCKERLYEVLKTIACCLSSGCRINKRKTILHTYQLLLAVT